VIKARYGFPAGFLWGTATSSHQVEGGNTSNDWYAWEQEPNHILHGHVSGEACGWWRGLWREDFDRAAKTHQNAHRLSIEWSRIEPSQATWDDDALDHYRQMILGAIERSLTPIVTLNHFTLPIWIAEQGGWLSQECPIWFERYVRRVVGVLKDLVKIWVTINEPNVLVYGGYLSHEFPPGLKDLRATPKALTNLVKAHAAAYHAIHELDPAAEVGVAHHFRGFQPRAHGNAVDRAVSRFRNHNFNDLFPHAFRDGRIQFLAYRAFIPQARNTQDFFGLNYYTTEDVSFNLLNPGGILELGGFPEDARVSPGGFIADVPRGFFDALRWANAFGLPIYVTENGVEDAGDGFRAGYLAHHLQQLWKCVNLNWRIKGYFHWTLVDNFEWERGWTQRFGLWSLDEKTQVRRKRPSADFYAEICRTGMLSSENVYEYVPEVFDDIFPPRGPSELLA
jgi:beta-glucosidase